MRIISLLILIGMSSCSNDPRLVQEFFEKSEIQYPTEQMKEVELLHTENGEIKVKIVAKRIQRFQERSPELVFNNGIFVMFYNNSIIESTLEANNGFVDEEKKIMIASGQVILKSDSKKLETEELIWDEKINKIYTEKKVKITTLKEIVSGEGFMSDPNFTKYSISKIKGVFNLESKETEE